MTMRDQLQSNLINHLINPNSPKEVKIAPAFTHPINVALFGLGSEPCREALNWVESLPIDISFEDAYNQCPRGDFLLWLAQVVNVQSFLIVLAVNSINQNVVSKDVLSCAERCAEGFASVNERRMARFDYSSGYLFRLAEKYSKKVSSILDGEEKVFQSISFAYFMMASADLVRGFIPWAKVAEKLNERLNEVSSVAA